MTDNAQTSSHMYAGFGHGGVTPNYNGIADQGRPCNEFSQYGAPFSQYGQGNTRTGYGVGGPSLQREGMVSNRHEMNWGSMNSFQSGCPPGQHQQRYLPSSGMPPGLPQSQLPGSAPTLNQLLMSPSNDQRFSGMCNDYSSSNQKASGPENADHAGYGIPHCGWGGQQRLSIGTYQQQMGSAPLVSQTSTNQGVGMYEVNRRANIGMGNRYPPPPPAPLPQALSSHHGSSSQNAPQYLGNMQSNLTAINPLCGQMQQQQSFSPNHSLVPTASHLQPSPSTTPLSQQSDHSSSNMKAQLSPQPLPTTKQKSKKQPKRQRQSKAQMNIQESGTNDEADNSASRLTPSGSNSSHPPLGGQLPNAAPSPAGSVSSRSNTPASLSGNMVGSPSTNHLDGQGRILSPFHSQGGNIPSGVGSSGAIGGNMHNLQQQMMPPPSMFPSHSGVSPGPSKAHVPPPPPLSPHMISTGSSQQMSAPPYNNVQYNNSHYGGRGPPGLMPGYSGVGGGCGVGGGHHELINGPHNHLLNYGPSGMINRSTGYSAGSFGNCLEGPGHFGTGYGVHHVGPSLGVPVSGGASSVDPVGYQATSKSGCSGEHGPGLVSGRMPSSVEDGSYSGRPVSSVADTPISSSQRPSFPVTPVADHHVPYSSGSDGGLGRNQYGMPPPYEVAGLAQQQQQQQQQQHNNASVAFGKPFIHSSLNRPGAGMFMRDHNPMIPGDERSRPSSRSMDGSDVASGRVSSLPGTSAGEKIFLKRPYDPMSYHGDGSLPIHYAPNPHVNSSSSRGLPDDANILPAIPGHHGQPYRADDTLPVHPSMQTNMGPPASNSYMLGDHGATMFGKGAQESTPGFTGTVMSSGFPKDKWMRQDQFQPSDITGKGNTPERERPRIYDEGSTSDTQSSDLGAASLPADDLVKFPGNIGHETCSGNGSLLNRVLTASIDDGKKGKSAKPKKLKQEKMSGLVTPSPLTPDHDAFDEISNASRPTTPKSEGNDVLNKLAEMGDEPDRRMFLDQLFAFMEEIRTPIISIPMISKTAIDLYRLYHLVREHGGMVEVTKNKKWRDISGALNIGPSSSAGFTLKKNYGKHLFGFECRFDRGNVDPVPILAMLEQPVKKESKKAAAERAAAAAANTQDMYRMSAGQQFGCYPGGNVHLPNGLDSSCNPDMIPGTPHQLPYDSSVGMMRHPGNMPNGGMIHPGLEGSMPPVHGMRNLGGGHGMMQSNCAGDIINIQDPFSDMPNQGSATLLRPGMNYMDYPGNVAGMTQRGLYGAPGSNMDGRTPKVSFGSPVANKSSLSPPMVRVDCTAGGGTYEGSRSDLLEGRSSLVGHDVAGGSQDSFQEYGNARRPTASGISSQRPGVESMHATNRYEPLPQQPPQSHMMLGEHEGAHHCRPSDEQTSVDQNYYGSVQASVHPRPVSDQQGGFSHGGYPPGYIGGQRILPPPVGVEKYYAPGAPGSLIDASGQQHPYAGSSSVVLPSRYEMPTPPHQRPTMKMEHRDGYSADCDIRKKLPWIPPGGLTPSYPVSYTPNTMLRSGHHSQGFSHSNQMGISQQKVDRSDRKMQMIPSRSEFHFPEDSVEAVQPRTVKRRRYTHKQLGPVDPWKLMMSLKSGLIAESTYALEVLSILLHDDSTVTWFGLQHLPGLVEVLLEHFRRCLIQIFPSDFDDLELGLEKQDIVWLGRIPNENKEVEVTQQLRVEVEKEVDGAIDDGSLQIEGDVTKTSNGLIVIFEENSQEETLMFDDKKWDVFEEIDSSLFDWQMGRGDTSAHILTRFTTETSFEFFEEKFFGRKHLSQIAENKLRIDEVADKEKTDTKSVEHSTKPADDDTAILSNLCDQTDDRVKLEEADDIPSVVSDHDDADKLDSKDADCHKLIAMDPEDEVRALEDMKRKWTEEEDIEISQPNDHSLLLVSDSQTDVSRRCLSISNIFRGLSFVPSNESEMSKHPGLLLIIGKLLKLYHTHTKQSHDSAKMYANAAYSEKADELQDNNSKARWCSETLEVLREDTFVILANISGQLDLSLYPEEIVSPILNGLLHWVTCSAACALDPLPTMPLSYSLSPRRLVLETLCKLCIADSNVDLLLAMPPYSRTVLFLSNLVQLVAESSDQVVREFAIVLISSLVQADSSAARAIALHRPSVSILLDFIELADHRAVHVVNTQGLAMLKGSPEMMGTSLDMLRRAASILCHMAEVPENKMIFARYHHRLLHLVMSQIMDQKVAAILAEVLYNSSLS